MTEKTVLISGGSKGLGLAIVESCLEAGWRVATFSRRATPRMAELCAAHNGRFHFFEGDLADRALPAEALKQVKDRFGRLDALVNNAAVAWDGILATMPAGKIEQMIDINLTSSILLTRECCREFLRMPRVEPKSIVNVSSIVGNTGFRGLSAYASTKAALIGFTRSLARELGPANVTVNALLPGFLITEMTHGLSGRQQEQIVRRTPMGRLGEGRDVGPMTAFLLGPQARFITGQSIVIDGGASC